jgi:glutamyl-tRNA synthetase
MAPGYDRHCRELSTSELASKDGEDYVVRLKMPADGAAQWDDLVRGNVKIEYKTQDDPIILKTDGWPTYHLANVIDDHEMSITHVIRGEEWIPSTPKHIALYTAFGWDPPKFAHLPVILGPDKSKLSKRHGDTAILDYREKGYLAEAMVNFLVQLGWNDGTEDEIFDFPEIIKRFSLDRVQKAPAVFDIEKLNWLNGQYIRKTETGALAGALRELYPDAKILKAVNFERILEIEKSRLTTLADIQEGNDYFLAAPKDISRIIVFKKSNPEDTQKGLLATHEALAYFEVDKWNKMSVEEFEAVLRKVAETNALSNGDVFWPIRVALSGLEKSPSPAELLWALGKDESLKRIKNAGGLNDEK